MIGGDGASLYDRDPGEGVVTVPVDLREAAGVKEDTELTWVEVAPRLWLVGPAQQHPETVAPAVEAILLTQTSPFPTLMRRFLSGDVPRRVGPGYRRSTLRREQAPSLSEEQMIALGAPEATPPRRRGQHLLSLVASARPHVPARDRASLSPAMIVADDCVLDKEFNAYVEQRTRAGVSEDVAVKEARTDQSLDPLVPVAPILPYLTLRSANAQSVRTA